MGLLAIQRYLLAIFLTSGLLSLAHADQMPATSGVIAIATEPASVKTVSLEGKVIGRTGGVGLPIYLNDEIKTGAQNRLQILLKDQSVFNIGPNSSLTIDKFVFDPTRPELSVNIQRGTFKFVSGKISNGNPEAMKVKLPNATIAVRGTGVAGEVAANGASTVVLLHGTVDVSSTAAGVSSTATLSKSGWGVQIGSAGNVSAPSLLPAETVNGILQKVGRASAAGAVVAGNPNQVPGSAPVIKTRANSTDSQASVTNTSGLSAASLAAARTALSTNSAAALNSSDLKLLQETQTNYIDRLSTSFCAICPNLTNTLGFTDTYYSSSDLKGTALRVLGPLGTVTFNNNVGNGTGSDRFTLTQTLIINYAAGTLSNQYSFDSIDKGKLGFRYASSQPLITTFSQLAPSGTDPHFFILPTDPTQTNLKLTAALGNSTQSGVSAGKVASFGYAINVPSGNFYTGISRVVGH